MVHEDCYEMITKAVVEQACVDFEKGYRMLCFKFGPEAFHPSDKELMKKLFPEESDPNADKNKKEHRMTIMRAYITAKRFLLSDDLKMYTDIDGGLMIEHIKGLVDKKQTIKTQPGAWSYYVKHKKGENINAFI